MDSTVPRAVKAPMIKSGLVPLKFFKTIKIVLRALFKFKYLQSKATHHWREYHNEAIEQIAVVQERSDLDNLQDGRPRKPAIVQGGKEIESQGYDVENESPCNNVGGPQSIIIDANAENR